MELILESTYLYLVLCDLFSLILRFDTGLLKILDDIFEGFRIRIEVFFGFFYYITRKSQLGGNRKSIALSGDADKEPVCGTSGFDIKLAAGVFDTFCPEGEDLDLGIVGRSHGSEAEFMHMFEYRYGKSGTFGRIRTRTELIEQAE